MSSFLVTNNPAKGRLTRFGVGNHSTLCTVLEGITISDSYFRQSRCRMLGWFTEHCDPRQQVQSKDRSVCSMDSPAFLFIGAARLMIPLPSLEVDQRVLPSMHLDFCFHPRRTRVGSREYRCQGFSQQTLLRITLLLLGPTIGN